MRRNITKLLGAAVLVAIAFSVNAGGNDCNVLSWYCSDNGCTPWLQDCHPYGGHTECTLYCDGSGPACGWHIQCPLY